MHFRAPETVFAYREVVPTSFFCAKKFRYKYLKRSPFHGFSEPVFFLNLLYC